MRPTSARKEDCLINKSKSTADIREITIPLFAVLFCKNRLNKKYKTTIFFTVKRKRLPKTGF